MKSLDSRLMACVVRLLPLGVALAVHGAAIERADVVVVGGGEAGVAAALAAKAKGSEVVLFENRPALGWDTAAKLVLEQPDGKLTQPLAIRKRLDKQLLDAKIPFRTWTYVKEIVRGQDGKVSGVTLVNRNGERFLPCRAVIDATERAYLAKAAGSKFKPFPAGKYKVRRRVVSGEEPKAKGLVAKKLGTTGVHKISVGSPRSVDKPAPIKGFLWECEFEFDFKDGSAFEFAALEQRARDLTWTKTQLESAQTCLFDAPDTLIEDAPGVTTVGPLASPRPTPNVQPSTPSVQPSTSYDAAIAGLGTGGGPAAVCASRAGLKVIAFEYSYHCGGVSTEGLIGNYYFGNCVGFTAEFDKAIRGFAIVQNQGRDEWLRRTAKKQGATLVYGAFVYGVEREGSRLTAFKVMLADGAPMTVKAKTFVDATGNCDIAAAAGEETEFINADELSLQGAAFMRKQLGSSYLNLDWTFINDCDAEDLWYLTLRGRNTYEDDGRWWDQSQMVDSRERRRLKGLFRVTAQDVMIGRKYPDIVCITRSNFDTHGQTVDPQLLMVSTEHRPLKVNLPLRAILPRKTDNLAVIGLGLSAARDAMPILRMVPDVQNQGWVAGKVCEYAVRGNCAMKDIDIKRLQGQLIRKGLLPDWVLTAEDTFPVKDADLAEAVAAMGKDYAKLEYAFADPKRAIPLLEKAYATAAESSPERLVYAHVLGMLGSKTGVGSLVKALEGTKAWDAGWQYRGMGQYGRPVSLIDSYIIALARSGKAEDGRAAVTALAKKLNGTEAYSHYRALALYYETIGGKDSAEVLVGLLKLSGVSGHAFSWEKNGAPRIAEYHVYNFRSPHKDRYQNAAGESEFERTRCLKELCLARALYRAGDADGLGRRTLEAYAADPRRAYAEHAQKVLAKAK